MDRRLLYEYDDALGRPATRDRLLHLRSTTFLNLFIDLICAVAHSFTGGQNTPSYSHTHETPKRQVHMNQFNFRGRTARKVL